MMHAWGNPCMLFCFCSCSPRPEAILQDSPVPFPGFRTCGGGQPNFYARATRGNEPASLSHRAHTGNLGKSDLLVLVLAHQTRAVVAGLLAVCPLRYCALLERSLVNGCCFRLQVEGAELHVIGRQLGIATSQVLRVGAGLSCNLSLVRTTGQSLAPTVTRSHAP